MCNAEGLACVARLEKTDFVFLVFFSLSASLASNDRRRSFGQVQMLDGRLNVLFSFCTYWAQYDQTEFKKKLNQNPNQRLRQLQRTCAFLEVRNYYGLKYYIIVCFIVKFRYCEKATTFEKISHLKTKWEIFSNFHGLRIPDLYFHYNDWRWHFDLLDK